MSQTRRCRWSHRLYHQYPLRHRSGRPGSARRSVPPRRTPSQVTRRGRQRATDPEPAEASRHGMPSGTSRPHFVRRRRYPRHAVRRHLGTTAPRHSIPFDCKGVHGIVIAADVNRIRIVPRPLDGARRHLSRFVRTASSAGRGTSRTPRPSPPLRAAPPAATSSRLSRRSPGRISPSMPSRSRSRPRRAATAPPPNCSVGRRSIAWTTFHAIHGCQACPFAVGRGPLGGSPIGIADGLPSNEVIPSRISRADRTSAAGRQRLATTVDNTVPARSRMRAFPELIRPGRPSKRPANCAGIRSSFTAAATALAGTPMRDPGGVVPAGCRWHRVHVFFIGAAFSAAPGSAFGRIALHFPAQADTMPR